MSREKPSFAVRSAPPPAAVEAFISGQRPAASLQPLASNSQQPEAEEPPRGTRRRGIVVRAGGVERARLTVYVDVQIAERLRRWAFEHGAELSEVAAEAIAAHVADLGQ